MILLIDCNNFFVSCERLFQPSLRDKPVIVLSNNDGCVVSRSQEAKKLGIAMGEPFFKVQERFNTQHLAVYSANFSLYANISQRVHTTIDKLAKEHGGVAEAYSIDEAFVTIADDKEPRTFGTLLRTTIARHIGIPVAVGIASTKTLAKVAADQAKKGSGVYQLIPEQVDTLLTQTPVTDIWGIGRKIGAQLQSRNILTALHFKQTDRHWIRKQWTVLAERTHLELEGIPAINHHDQIQKSLVYSRSFGSRITSRVHLEEAASLYASRAAEKLRRRHVAATSIGVFLTTGRHAELRYSNSATITLPQATQYTPTLIAHAQQLVRQLYQEGYAYKKVGVSCIGLIPADTVQQALFCHKEPTIHTQQALMTSLDVINAKGESNTIQYASCIQQNPAWHSHKNYSSPRYTTVWQKLPVAHSHS